ncbi:MAG: hypothetical protein ACI9IA_001273 [Enterobacterales bacterium]|jgi:hypothetical protein
MTDKKNKNNSKDELSTDPKTIDKASEEEIDSFEELGLDVDLDTNLQDDLQLKQEKQRTPDRMSEVDDTAIQNRLVELEAELAAEQKSEENDTAHPSESLQTKVAADDEGLTDIEIDNKLDEVQAVESKFKSKKASEPNALESISVSDLSIEENDSDKDDLECLNCAAPLGGPYCHNCGQPDRHFIRFFPKVLWEMVNEAFDLDSKALRTLVPLYFSPGRLSMEYFSGRRARYVNPLRLYIILSVLFFITISLFTGEADDFVVSEGSNGVNARVRSGDDTEKTVPHAAQEKALELLKEQKANGLPISDEMIIEAEKALTDLENNKRTKRTGLVDEEGRLKIRINDAFWDIETNPLTFNDTFTAETTKELNQFFWTMGLKLDKALKDDPSDLLDEFLNVIPQLMFILLPIFALLLKITYIFKKRYYMEHLIVALHNHCFMFFSLLLIILMSYLEDNLSGPTWLMEGIDYLTIFMIIWIPLNLYIGMKRVYAQGYILTFLKFIFIALSYNFLLTITAASAFVLGLAKM